MLKKLFAVILGVACVQSAHAETTPAFDMAMEPGVSTVETHQTCTLYPVKQDLCVGVYIDNASHTTHYSFSGVDMGNPNMKDKSVLTIYRLRSDSKTPFTLMRDDTHVLLDSAQQQIVYDPDAPSGTDVLVWQSGTARTVHTALAQSDSVMRP